MNPVDPEGRIFGTINVVDAFVVLLVLVIVAGGALFVLGGPLNSNAEDTVTTSVGLQVKGVQPFVSTAIAEGPVPTDRVIAVENKSVRPTMVVVKAENGTLYEQPHPQNRTVSLTVTLNATRTDDGLVSSGKTLEVGRVLNLDLGDVTINGTITTLGRQ